MEQQTSLKAWITQNSIENLEYQTVLQKSWYFLSYWSWDSNTNPL